MLNILIPKPESITGESAKYFYRDLSNLKQDILKKIGKEAYIGEYVYKDPERDRDRVLTSEDTKNLTEFVIDSGCEKSHIYFNGMIFIILSYIYIEKHGVNGFIEASIKDILELNKKYKFSFFIYEAMTFYHEEDNKIMNMLYDISTALYKEKQIARSISVTDGYVSTIRSSVNKNIVDDEIVRKISEFKKELLKKSEYSYHNTRRPIRAKLLINLFRLIFDLLDVNVEVNVTNPTRNPMGDITNIITSTHNLKVYEYYTSDFDFESFERLESIERIISEEE